MPEYMKPENNIILRKADQDISVREADNSHWKAFNYLKDKATQFEDLGATVDIYMMATIHDNTLCVYKYVAGEDSEVINSFKLDGKEKYDFLVGVTSYGNDEEMMTKFINSVKDKFDYNMSEYSKNKVYLKEK